MMRKRFVNLIIDMFLCRLLFAVIVGIYRNTVSHQLFWMARRNWGLWFFVMFFYYLIFEAALYRTPGKFITGTEVVMIDGTKPSFGVIAARTLCRFAPFEPASILAGDTWWHDRWTDTRVVNAQRR